MATSIGKFEVLKPLGQGPGSAILKILRKSDGKVYALKVITVATPEDLKYITQSEREFEVGSQLDHPHLLKVYGFERITSFFRVKGSRLLLEYVPGKTLAECEPLPISRLVRVFARVADGLTSMHSKGFYHADMKPDNIMVGTDGAVKVIDFGLAWSRGEKKDRVQGTLEFLAPEQAQKRIVNTKTDIFNFGATMHRLLTGNPIPDQLRESTGAEMISPDSLVRPLRESHPQVPERLDVLVRQCLRVKPEKRPRIMRQVRDELREIARQFKAKSKRKPKDDPS